MDNKPKILLFDLESMPNLTRTWGKWEQNTIWNERDWYLWSFSFKWLGDKKINNLALPDFPLYKKDKYNDKALTQELWKLFDEADILIAHNGNAFDIKKAKTLFLKHRLNPPKPCKYIDTKLVAKRHFNFDSNSLNDLCEFLGIGKKMSTGGLELWRDCERGDKKAWEKMKQYNNYDVKLLEEVYKVMLPYMDNHPNIALLRGNILACPNCGSHKVQRRGYDYTRAGKSQRFQCQNCASWHKAPLNGGQIR